MFIVALTPVCVALLWEAGAFRQQHSRLPPFAAFALVIWMGAWFVILLYL